MDTEKATFAAGCFWGVQAAFDKVRGVKSTLAGYTGGRTKDPSYEEVCTGETGHAEAVQVEYDPGQASYDGLLEVFWSIHDPTRLNRQGPDTGSQYRSAIFCHSEEQRTAALSSLAKEREKYARNIFTQVLPAGLFYAAEGYHQHCHDK
ncbi:MAG: peptide-methionine (S)-S-oxide reductase MsrA [Candidatus Altiarchaeota archaeon]|nr:peptide-methionine (S)-S-oxide reductase MsrA [Candidatus Altiarchaeota archaeon]